MESYLLFAIASIFFTWIFNFLLKVVSERNYDSSRVTIYSYSVLGILGLFYTFVNWDIWFDDNFWFAVSLALIGEFFFSMSIFSRVESMKHIDTVIFFPLYKTIWPIIITLISVFFFKEVLSVKEFLGIVCGILVPLGLVTKAENKIQKNLFLGIALMALTAILTSVTGTTAKSLMNLHLSMAVYLFARGVFGMLFSSIIWKVKSKKPKKYNSKWIMLVGFPIWLFQFLGIFTFTHALTWNLAVVSTINSFSILIPIILSIIFYKEHFNLRKGIVILLSIISIILFI